MKYPGGKGKCYQHIINLMPPHETYIESHLGGGAVLRNKKPSARSIGIDIDPSVIGMWKSRTENVCELIQADATTYLQEFSFNGNELVYSDPPYLPATRRQQNIYRYEYGLKEHADLLHVLANLPCMVVLSGYDSELYNDTLTGWNKKTFQAKTHTDVRTETIWFNFPLPTALHDPAYLGNNFRERQTIKRRQERLRNRIAQMNPIERNEIITWINERYGGSPQEATCKSVASS